LRASKPEADSPHDGAIVRNRFLVTQDPGNSPNVKLGATSSNRNVSVIRRSTGHEIRCGKGILAEPLTLIS
jgi:hypothetical protein